MKLNITKSKGFTKVGKVKIPDSFYNRFKTGDDDIDKMFGDGILPGCAFTITAQAGTGKTTMMLQIMEALEAAGYQTGYTSGEEDVTQLAFTCKRLNIKEAGVANMTDVDEIADAMKTLDVIVIDSFQALSIDESVHGKMNSRGLEKYACDTLTSAAKVNNCSIFFIMHLTKDGKMKGGTLVPHSVDCNIQLMHEPEMGDHALTVSFYKNRFGATNDYPAEMTASGIKFSGDVFVPQPKRSEKDKHKDAVLEMKQTITKTKLINTLGVSSGKAYIILKDLCDEGKLAKVGRGPSATFMKL